MIFCKLLNPLHYQHTEGTLQAMRDYASKLLNWCAAKRDYPYAQHSEPEPDPCLRRHKDEIRVRVLREFNRR